MMSQNDKQSDTLSLVVFIDALGWEVLKGRKFLEEELPYRRKLRSVFGFSSACIPSILTGRMPQQHKHWSFFYYDPQQSPFKPLRFLRWLPAALTDRGRVRSVLSKFIKKAYGFGGYFQIYNLPLKFAHLFDYCEKRDLFAENGINEGASIVDYLHKAGRSYHLSDWRVSESQNLASLKRDIRQHNMNFGFLYMADMDALLHRVGKASVQVDEKLAWYEQQLGEVLQLGRKHYDDVRLFICSDHGMATVHTYLDLMAEVEKLDVVFGRDYTATYDSTMGRFWFHNTQAREVITACLNQVNNGRILSLEELDSLGCAFEGNQYGELIFLADPGVLIVPSHMGTKPIVGMHGYHPDHPDSDASLLSNVEPSVQVNGIPDIFHLMRAEAGV